MNLFIKTYIHTYVYIYKQFHRVWKFCLNIFFFPPFPSFLFINKYFSIDFICQYVFVLLLRKTSIILSNINGDSPLVNSLII